MDARTKALLAAVISIIVFSLLLQRARRKLTPDQLFALERVNRIGLYTFLPIVPFLVALAIVYFTQLPQRVTFWGSVVASVVLFAWDQWRSHRKRAAADLPREYLNSHNLGVVIVLIGVITSIALVAQGIQFRG